jgi:hypothetical protein
MNTCGLFNELLLPPLCTFIPEHNSLNRIISANYPLRCIVSIVNRE